MEETLTQSSNMLTSTNSTTLLLPMTASPIVSEDKSEKIIEPAVFILFAEYLGLKSKLIEWADRACNGETIPPEIESFMKSESMMLYKAAVEFHGVQLISDYYQDYYPLILEKYEKSIKNPLGKTL